MHLKGGSGHEHHNELAYMFFPDQLDTADRHQAYSLTSLKLNILNRKRLHQKYENLVMRMISNR